MCRPRVRTASGGGGITTAACNWLGSALDATNRSQIMLMDRDDNLSLNGGATSLLSPEW